jgi:hypothetical protein
MEKIQDKLGINWTPKKVKVADLKLWPENPRIISPEAFLKLKQRITERGFHDIVKVDTENVLLSGNQRKRALEDLEVKEVYAMIPNRKLTEKERETVALESNRDDGKWDFDMLANFDEEILKDVGFDQNELDNVFGLETADEFDEEKELQDYLESKGQKILDNHEMILYAQRGDSAWGKAKGSRFWMIGDHITWIASSESSTGQNVIFGTKPIQILVPYIKILSPREGIVMEPFTGSGSTIIACEIMKRKCRAIEISEKYAEVIINRFERFSGKKAVKLTL